MKSDTASCFRLATWTVRALVPASLAALGLALASPGFADASLLYVNRASPACSDSGPGTESQPFCTISAAAARVGGGQTVEVASGAYPEKVSISRSGTAAAPIAFRGAPGATVTLSGKANGFSLWGVSWIAVSGFSVTNTSGYGIVAGSSSHLTIAGNHVSYAGQPLSGLTASGIRLSNVSDSAVSGNTADHNSDNGILLTDGSTRNDVRANHAFANARGYQRAATGIRLYSAPANTVASNLTHDNEDSGIECYVGSNDSLLYNNVSYGNGDHGIDAYQSTGERIVSNSVYRNVTAGINVEGGSTGATVANNASVDNGIQSPRTHGDIRVEAGSTAGTTMDSDLAYLTTADTLLIWNSTSYRSLASFQAATGQEAHGKEADPKWRDRGAGDFRLNAGSPAIDSADSGVSGQPGTDIEGRPRVDDPNSPNVGLGSRPYDDRGAYEFQPASPAPLTAPSVPPASGPTPVAFKADASAPRAGPAPRLSGRKWQRLGTSVTIRASCSPGCAALVATGRLGVGRTAGARGRLRRRKWFQLISISRPPWKGVVTLRLRVPPRARRAAAGALSRGGRVTTTVILAARPSFGGPLLYASRQLLIGSPTKSF